MLVYSTNLVFSFLNYIYVWGARGRPPSREPVLVPLPGLSSTLAIGSLLASRVRGATSPRHLQGQQRELRTPRAMPQRRTRGFRSPSDRRDPYLGFPLAEEGRTPPPRAESEDKTGIGFGVREGQGEVRKEYHWTSKECDPGKRR